MNPKTKLTLFSIIAIIAVVAVGLLPLTVQAAQLTDRKVTLGSSRASFSTSHNFQFSAPSSTTIRSIDFTYCTTPSGACTTPTGITTTTAALNGVTNLGSGGSWTVGGTPTNGRVQIANNSNTGSPSANATVNFNTITNPSTVGAFYVRIVTYSDNVYSATIDSGTVAAATANQIQVTAAVDETLNFCAFQTGSTCGGGTGTTVGLGSLSSSTATTGTSKLVAGTNATSGYVVQYTGDTLKQGSNSIAATGTSGSTSSTGNAQFGINLVANTGTPTVGSNPSGGSGSASTNYGTNNTYSYVANTLTQIASASGSTADTLYTVSYLANIPSNQAAGSYATTLTYLCTATF